MRIAVDGKDYNLGLPRLFEMDVPQTDSRRQWT